MMQDIEATSLMENTPTNHVQIRMALVFNTLMLLLALLVLLGIVLDIPFLYTWKAGSMAIALSVDISLILLALGFYIVALPLSKRPLFRVIAGVCFFSVFAFASMQLWSFFTAPGDIPLSEYLQSQHPIRPRIPFYATLGLTLASIGSLIHLYSLNSSRPGRLIVQFLSLFLINTALFSLLEVYEATRIFGYFAAIPASTGLLFYGIALFFLPSWSFDISRIFFSTRRMQLYAALVCVFWLGTVFWQSIILALPSFPGTVNMAAIRNILLLEDLLDVIFSTVILGFGLHIIANMDRSDTLARNLKAAFENQSILAATLSHDLKAPLQTQISAVEMVQSGHFGNAIADERVQRILASIAENNHYCLDLVSNLVELLRFEVAEERFEPRPIELNPLLMEVREEILPWTERKHQALVITPCPHEDQILTADPIALKRVLHNLITNAIQHLESSSQIQVLVQPQPAEFWFYVRDNGPGIPPEKQAMLFQRFHMSGGAKTLASSGLGLYIAKRIVERHGGSIRVESSVGQGTTIFFSLPRQAPRNASLSSPAQGKRQTWLRVKSADLRRRAQKRT